jgi:hypothetical protein
MTSETPASLAFILGLTMGAVVPLALLSEALASERKRRRDYGHRAQDDQHNRFERLHGRALPGAWLTNKHRLHRSCRVRSAQ